MIDKILDLMTPVSVLESTEFKQAFPILPERFPTFDDLILWREHIRDLILLPVKSDEMRAYYKTLDKNQLAENVWKWLGDSRFIIGSNEFPYMVPQNTDQFIIWIKDPSESRENVAEFVKTIIESNNYNLDDVILFERPIGITTKLVRGTFPLIRHMHFWTRSTYQSS
jgi:hypothetical protein